MEKFFGNGAYLNPQDNKKYEFFGLFWLNGQTFTGMINDGRCPAEVIDGRVDKGIWRFNKRYRSDKAMLDKQFFKFAAGKGDEIEPGVRIETHPCNDFPEIRERTYAVKKFPEKDLGCQTAPQNNGIIYYGRTLTADNNVPVVAGFFNSSQMGEKYQAFDNYVRRLSLSDLVTEKLPDANPIEVFKPPIVVPLAQEGGLTNTNVGPWNMAITRSGESELPSSLLKIGKKKSVSYYEDLTI